MPTTLLRTLVCALACLVGSAYLITVPAFCDTAASAAAREADANQVNFVRPGVVLKITAAEIAADGTIRVTFQLTDPKGAPLDRLGITTPGSVSTSFIAAYIPKGKTQYVSYATRPQTSPITNVTAQQAGTDSGGAYELIAEGQYRYTFKTKAPAGFDKTVTHAIGAYATRNLTEFDLGSSYSNVIYHFVPDGSKVTQVRDIIATASCNKCHHGQGFHGGSRQEVELCAMCHQPQTIDPDTGNTVDLPVMIHKIHMGSSLPSVVAGKKYQIIGHNQTVADYSGIAFPADARNCRACHEPGTTQADSLFKPTRAACGACHDNVNFETGENHLDLPQVSDAQCANCHPAHGEAELDASIMGAHTIPRLAGSLPGVCFELLAVNEGVAGKRPIVSFSVKDKAGNPIPLSNMSRLNLVLAGPTSDYTTYVSEDVRKAEGTTDGRYWWTMTKPIPADAKGSFSISIEGRRELKLREGTTKEVSVRDSGANKVMYFTVDGSKVEPRRTVVSTAKCNACHGSLAAHGDNRNAVEHCVVCHNPTMTGSNQTINLGLMIHRIHTGKELQLPYKIGNANFNLVGYPGDRRNCAACHVNGSEQLPLSEKLVQVADPGGWLNPVGPATAACTGCHSSIAAASHALSNTTKLGEACAACHGPDAEFSVTKMHAK